MSPALPPQEKLLLRASPTTATTAHGKEALVDAHHIKDVNSRLFAWNESTGCPNYGAVLVGLSTCPIGIWLRYASDWQTNSGCGVSVCHTRYLYMQKGQVIVAA